MIRFALIFFAVSTGIFCILVVIVALREASVASRAEEKMKPRG